MRNNTGTLIVVVAMLLITIVILSLIDSAKSKGNRDEIQKIATATTQEQSTTSKLLEKLQALVE